jgi:DNA repair exonuclease SbcCD nuclease subunit
MKFIHAADLHLDSPLRGLSRYEDAPAERLRGATRCAFEQLIELAVREAVDFVLLAGDIYDGDWHDFKTGLYFREQMARLGRAHIPVYIIHGNHDAASVISKQLSLPDHVHVCSSRTVESFVLDDLGAAIHGRSFPKRAMTQDLVPDYPEPVAGYVNIGLLHTSLTGRQGHDSYAPTDLSTLIGKGYDYWALGHVHKREVVNEAQPRVVFPGNIQGRHAKETGAKGCELVTIEAGAMEATFVPLDVLRWQQLSLDVSGLAHIDDVAPCFQKAMSALLADDAVDFYALRIQLTGATALAAVEAEQPGTLDAAIRAAAQDVAVDVWVEKVQLSITAPLDRELMAQRQDAVGELIRMVDGIAADEAALTALVDGETQALLKYVPRDVQDSDALPLDALSLLRDAEATVLALLASAEVTHEN